MCFVTLFSVLVVIKHVGLSTFGSAFFHVFLMTTVARSTEKSCSLSWLAQKRVLQGHKILRSSLRLVSREFNMTILIIGWIAQTINIPSVNRLIINQSFPATQRVPISELALLGALGVSWPTVYVVEDQRSMLSGDLLAWVA